MNSAIGIDFGTSNCTAFIPTGSGEAVAVPLEGNSPLLPSVIFSTRKDVAVRQVAQQEFSKRMKEARQAERANVKAGGASISEEVLRKTVEDALNREALKEAERKYWDQTFFSMLKDGGAALYGTPAMNAYIADPLSGTLMKSPKSFLGSRLRHEHVLAFENVVTSVIGHIKQRAEDHAGRSFSRVVLGRPVNYHGSNSEFSNTQAISIMSNAAKNVGFKEIQFCLEPIAAALTYEKTLTQEKRVLVIDIGGGTTDCTMIKVGPQLVGKADRTADVLSCSGDRVGGTDFDQSFAWTHFMPIFGKKSHLQNGLQIPVGLFYDAISTRDIPAQQRFNGSSYQIRALKAQSDSPDLIARFQRLHANQYQHRLIHSSELSKIALSAKDSCTTPLKYIEEGLSLECKSIDFENAVWKCLDQIEAVSREALNTAGTSPDAVFVTGGMGFSPTVRSRLQKFLNPGISIQYGDMLGSVGMGLGLKASQYI